MEGLPAGAAAVHLREKDLCGRDLLALARALREVLSRAGQLLLVNDRVDVALASGADGVHLPSRGMGAEDARRLLGPRAWVGVSCHSDVEVVRARDAAASFATFSPVYDTPSKRALGQPVGVASLREASRLGLPLVALGGVDAGRVGEVMAAGAVGVAAIRAWLAVDDPARAVRELLAATGEGTNHGR